MSDELIESLFDNTLNNKTKLVKKIITTNKIEVDVPRDKYNNTLLHIATIKLNYDLIKYLLDNGSSTSIKNKFGDTSYDLAIGTNEKKIIDMYYNVDKYKMDIIIAENKYLTNKNEELSKQNNEYKEIIQNMQSEINTHKRKRDEFEKLYEDNKKLVNQNNILKTTVENMRKTK